MNTDAVLHVGILPHAQPWPLMMLYAQPAGLRTRTSVAAFTDPARFALIQPIF
jgi:hypothetical protein